MIKNLIRMTKLFHSNVESGILAMVILLTCSSCFGQENQNTKQKPPSNSQGVTSDQSTRIKKILSAYNASKLTTEEARAIQNQFREAGIHAGPGNNEAIRSLGFDPEKLRNLAPPPESGKTERPNPPPLQERLKVVEEKICKPLSLTTMQRDKIIIAFSEFYTEMDKLTKSQPGSQGPPEKSKVDPLENTRNLKVKQLLEGEQFKKFLDLEKEVRPERPGEKKPKPN